MKKFLTISVSMLTAAVLCTACIIEETPLDEEEYVAVGDRVPSFTVSGPDGTFASPEGFAGKTSVLILFNGECGDCQREMPKVYALWQKINGNPVRQVVAIARDQTAEDVAADWPHGDMPYYADPDREVYNLFATTYIPRIYIVDSRGTVQWMAVEKLENADGSQMTAKQFEEIFLSYEL